MPAFEAQYLILNMPYISQCNRLQLCHLLSTFLQQQNFFVTMKVSEHIYD